MRVFFLYLFLVSVCHSHSQDSRIPNESRVPNKQVGNFLLYKSDSLIVSYYWDTSEVKFEQCFATLLTGKEYSIMLHLQINNLTKDTFEFKCSYVTIEAIPNKTSWSTDDNLKHPGYEYCEPNNSTSISDYSSTGEIVDFKFTVFKLLFKSGKTIDIKKQVNLAKQQPNKIPMLID